MSRATVLQFAPRKTPLQSRSAATVDAIMQATIQVLLREGKSKLTTTRVAERAGVSVGTLYQYFPNKGSLLQALLQAHLGSVANAMESACAATHGASLAKMAKTITTTFVQAKFRHSDTSVALYAVSDEVEGKRIAHGMHVRVTRAVAAMLQTARARTIAEPQLAAATLLSAMAGVSRGMLETGVTRGTMATMEQELTVMVHAYLRASAGNVAGLTRAAAIRPGSLT